MESKCVCKVANRSKEFIQSIPKSFRSFFVKRILIIPKQKEKYLTQKKRKHRVQNSRASADRMRYKVNIQNLKRQTNSKHFGCAKLETI